MILETLAALVFLLFTAPAWVLIAILWGIFKAAITFVHVLIEAPRDETFEISDIWIAVALPVIQGVASAVSVPAAMWNWAKFGHPWWAILIAFVAFSFWSRR